MEEGKEFWAKQMALPQAQRRTDSWQTQSVVSNRHWMSMRAGGMVEDGI